MARHETDGEMIVDEGFNLFGLEERCDYLQKYGQSFVAFTTLQVGMQFFDVRGVGFIAFRETFLSRVHILGDPVARADDYIQMVECLSKMKRICSASQISGHFAQTLRASFGLKVNSCGYEALVSPSQFSLDGKRMAALRHKRNNCIKSGIQVSRLDPREHPTNRLRQISDSWMKLKRNGAKELGFLTRPMQTPLPTETVTLVGTRGKDILGFVTYDPLYKNQQVIGYYASILRQKPKAPNGLLDFINFEQIRLMNEAGLKVFSLGWSPLAGLSSQPNEGASYWTHQMLRFAYNYLNAIYAFKNLAFHKERYRPRRNTLYFAFDTGWPVLNFLELYYLAGILSLPNMGHALRRAWACSKISRLRD